jgi:glutamine synthetase
MRTFELNSSRTTQQGECEDEFATFLENSNASNVHIGIFDLNGTFRHKRVDVAKAKKLNSEGYPFCSVLYDWDTAEQVYSDGAFHDKPATIDVSSLRHWPFNEHDALCIADFDLPFGCLSPRNQLIHQLDRANATGFSVHSAFEFEFIVLDETAASLREKSFDNLQHFAPGNTTYSLKTAVENDEMLDEFCAMNARMGIAIDSLHTELGPGCFEAPLVHAEGIKAADDAALFKNFTKAFFARKGLTAGFMSKFNNSLPGQSGHLHLSLRDLETNSPAFHCGSTNDGLSDTARYFIGGLVSVLPEWLALCSHTVNAYKRLVPGAWAPTYASWGIQNRTSAIRVINDTPDSTRLEFRVPSADTNPYSALAMCIAAGLRGIELQIEPPSMRDDDCYSTAPTPETQFPHDLTAAAERLANSVSARAEFGDDFIECFTRSCLVEDRAYRSSVAAWERERYLEIV